MLSLFLALSFDLPHQKVGSLPLLAQATPVDNPCANTSAVRAADTLRELELEQFGVAVMIPDNYRAILRNNGSVQVVDPGTYNLIRCEIRGGDPLARGFSQLVIRSPSTPADQSSEAIDLEAVVRENVASERPSRGPGLSNQCISPYPLGDKQGYLVQTPTQTHAEFWVEPNVGADITVLETSCDCSGMVERLTTVLSRTTLLSESQDL